MIKVFSIVVITFFVITLGHSQQTKNVAFLGNSYTYANNLPLMISKLAQSVGDQLNYTSSTIGGYTLQDHSTNSSSTALLQQNGLDYVILQEQSQLPSFPISQVVTDVFPYATVLCDITTQYNTCARPIFFMTWGRKYGDGQNCSVWPPVCTYQGMDSLLNLRYRQMADSNDAFVSPAGAVWHYIRDMDSNIELYSSDYSHPSLAGSYAVACTFYAIIFQKDPSLITDDYGIDAVVALQIRSAAKAVAFDSLQKWNVGKYLPKAQFSFNVDVDSLSVTNLSQYADTYHWEFGDGDTSILEEPYHIYTHNGTYQLKLIASKCNNKDTIVDTITVNSLSVVTSKDSKLRIFPNPANEQINIEFEKQLNFHPSEITIFNILGQEIIKRTLEGSSKYTLNIATLKSGMYFYSIVSNGNILKSDKFIKGGSKN